MPENFHTLKCLIILRFKSKLKFSQSALNAIITKQKKSFILRGKNDSLHEITKNILKSFSDKNAKFLIIKHNLIKIEKCV